MTLGQDQQSIDAVVEMLAALAPGGAPLVPRATRSGRCSSITSRIRARGFMLMTDASSSIVLAVTLAPAASSTSTAV